MAEFQGTLYDNTADMLAGLAYEFWTANGANSADQISEMIASGENAVDAADEAINGWGLDFNDDDAPSHMEANSYTRADLIDAMQAFIDTRPDIEVEEGE